MTTFNLETLNLAELGRSNSESIEFASDGSRWPDVHVYIRRGWSDDGKWSISVNHSSSSSSEDLARTQARLDGISKAMTVARMLDTPESHARLEANYQAARGEARAQMEREQAEKQAKIDADPAMGEMSAADRILDLIDAARAAQGQTQTLFAQTRGDRRRIKFTAVRNWGTNMVFIKMNGQLTSKEKAIKALGAAARELPVIPTVTR